MADEKGGRVLLRIDLDDTDAQKTLDKLERQESVVSAKVEINTDRETYDKIQAILNDVTSDVQTKAHELSKIFEAEGTSIEESLLD